MASTKQIFQILLASVVASVVRGNCEGDYMVRNQQELLNIAACSEIKGSVTIDPLFSGPVDFKKLEKVTGDLKISGDKIHRIELLELKQVQNLVISKLPNLDILHIAKLNSVDSLVLNEVGKVPSINFGHGLENAKTIEISSNGLKDIENINVKTLKSLKLNSLSQLSEVSFHKLESVDFMEIRDNALLKSTNFPLLTTVGSIQLKNLLGFETLLVPNVNKIESIELDNNTKLKNLSFPELKTAGKSDIKNNVALESVSFPKLELTTGDTLFTANPQATIDLPLLKDAGAKLFFNTIKDAKTPKLKYVIALKFQKVASQNISLDQLLGVTEAIHVSNNDKLESVAFPLLSEISKQGIFIQENPVMTKISFPKLTNIKGKLQINEPSVTEIVWNPKLTGPSSDVVANIPNCAEFKKLSFNHDQCVAQGATKNDVLKSPEEILNKNKIPEKINEIKKEGSQEDKIAETGNKEVPAKSSSNALLAMPAVSGLIMVAFSMLF